MKIKPEDPVLDPTLIGASVMNRRRALGVASATLSGVALGISGQPSAQGTYPNRPLKMIVPWPPGQATDLAGRVVAQELVRLLGQPVVVDNRAGAGGTIGTETVVKSAPDGYTILAASAGPVTVSPLLSRTPYDPERDLLPVGMIGMSPYVLVTQPGFAAADLREFVARVRASPGKFTFASSGTGATAHLIAESFNAAVGIKAVHVPYKGSTPALTDLISGQVDYCIETAAATMPHVRSGRLRAFGVSLEKGSAVTPGIAPFARQPDMAGLAGFDMGAWLGVMVPANTPSAEVQKLAGALEQIMLSPEVRQAFSGIAVEVDYRPAESFGRYLASIRSRFTEVIRANNIKAD